MPEARERPLVPGAPPIASIETIAKTLTQDQATSGVLLEARLSWGADTIAVRHVPGRGAIRVRDLGLELELADATDLVVGMPDESGTFGLRLPSGAPVPSGCRMTLRLGRTSLRLTLVPDDVAKLPRARLDPRSALGILGAAALHVVVVGLVAHSRTDVNAAEGADRQTMLRMMASAEERALAELAAAQEKSHAERVVAAAAAAAPRERAAAGNPSKTSETVARARTARREGEGPRAAKPQREEASTFGILALLGDDALDARSGSSAFAPESGPSAMGNIFGQTIDDAAGMGGLGLTGPGEGGGGLGAGVALGSIGTLGCCGGTGPAGGWGEERKKGTWREHVARSPTMTVGATQVNGRLPPEAVQRVVRQSFGRLRACYEGGLQRNPGLEGRLTVKFVIDREGQVALAAPMSDGTSLDDASVRRCVVRAYEAMTFPKPVGGIVTVVYPVVFTSSAP